MPDSSISKTLNGATVVSTTNSTADKADADKREPYRPKASTDKVYEEVARSLASVVTTAFSNAGSFVYLAEHFDRDESTAVRFGHLVDATECAEIAMTHLGQLKALFSLRLRTEDERNGDLPF